MKGLGNFIRSKGFFYFILAAIFGVYLAGMFVDVMEVDAAQYAAMSMEMLQREDWLHFYDRGAEYLDKPPLLFWLAGTSYKLFGISNFAYKLPSVLAGILAIYSTYRLGKLWYDEEAGRWAALILASCQAFFIFHNDVRTDALLTGAVTFSLWQLSEYIKTNRSLNFVLGFTGIGLAMLAKGPIGLVVPAAAFGGHFLLRREWKMIFSWRWLIGLAIILVVLSPMLWGLYTQFDLHPEKTVNGQTGVSGLRFYFWTQSFGRITGESVWVNDPSPFYFVPTFMWMFLPWCLWFLWALGKELLSILKTRLRLAGNDEGLMLAGFVLVFLALSLSRYKLPHYILVIMPLASLLLAKHLRLWRQSIKSDAIAGILKAIHPIFLVSLAAGGTWMSYFIFPSPPRQVLIGGAILVIFGILTYIHNRGVWRLVSAGALTITAVNLLLNVYVFPQLLEYQSGSAIGKDILEESVPTGRLRTLGLSSHALDFYTRTIVPEVFAHTHVRDLASGGPIWIFTDEGGYNNLLERGLYAQSVQTFPQYHVSKMTPEFLDPKARQYLLTKRYLVRY